MTKQEHRIVDMNNKMLFISNITKLLLEYYEQSIIIEIGQFGSFSWYNDIEDGEKHQFISFVIEELEKNPDTFLYNLELLSTSFYRSIRDDLFGNKRIITDLYKDNLEFLILTKYENSQYSAIYINPEEYNIEDVIKAAEDHPIFVKVELNSLEI